MWGLRDNLRCYRIFAPQDMPTVWNYRICKHVSSRILDELKVDISQYVRCQNWLFLGEKMNGDDTLKYRRDGPSYHGVDDQYWRMQKTVNEVEACLMQNS
jgi:hypothetical protein